MELKPTKLKKVPLPKIARVPLERVYRNKGAGTPIVVVDFRVHLHAILKQVEDYASIHGVVKKAAPEDADAATLQDIVDEFASEVMKTLNWHDWVKASWAIRLNRGPDMLPFRDYRIIIVDDNKLTVAQLDDQGDPITTSCYWRHLQQPSYKGNRAVVKDAIFRYLVDAGQQLAERLELPFYSTPLYEADDWAGLIHRYKKAAPAGTVLAQRELFYSTVDSDWLQLVDDPSLQLWANTGPWPSRLKNEAETRAYILKRMGKQIKHPSEVAKVKQLTGDTADNLAVGAALNLFDLCNPHPDYDLLATPQAADLLANLENPAANNSERILDNAISWLNYNDYGVYGSK